MTAKDTTGTARRKRVRLKPKGPVCTSRKEIAAWHILLHDKYNVSQWYAIDRHGYGYRVSLLRNPRKVFVLYGMRADLELPFNARLPDILYCTKGLVPIIPKDMRHSPKVQALLEKHNVHTRHST